jgi:hypothetical protein
MAKKRKKYHLLRPLLVDHGDGYADPGAIAECDAPNARTAAPLLTSKFAEDFGDGTFRSIDSGKVVRVADVCLPCQKARSKRAAGNDRPKRARKAA